MGKLHLFELRSGHILLDGVTIRGIRECEFSIKENDSLAGQINKYNQHRINFNRK